MHCVLLGNLSKDCIYTEQGKIIKDGGPVFYMTQVFANFKERVGICSKFNKLPVQLKRKYIDSRGFIKAMPTTIDIFENKEKCYGVVSQYAGQINFEQIPREYFKAQYFIISTIFDDISIQTIQKIRKEYPNIKICLDIHGYIREKKLNSPAKKRRINPSFLKGLEIVKFNKEEFNIQFKNIKTLIVALRDLDIKMCLITEGARKIKVFVGSDIYEYQPKITKTNNTVGAGDMLLAYFVYLYCFCDNLKIKEALKKASDCVSQKLGQR